MTDHDHADSRDPGAIHNSVGPGQLLLVAMIWAVIAIVNLAYARRR